MPTADMPGTAAARRCTRVYPHAAPRTDLRTPIPETARHAEIAQQTRPRTGDGYNPGLCRPGTVHRNCGDTRPSGLRN